MALLEAFQRYVAENDLATHDDRILLTVSGGVDSMVMLSLFTRSGYSVGVAHCNFQLRGAESDEDEVLVEEEAKKYGVEFYNKRFETTAEMERTGESMEMAARRLRYAWFDTPKPRTLPAVCSVSNASATSSGSTSASGRCSSSTSR